MARQETLFEEEIICVKTLFAENNVEAKCTCPTCTGRGNRMPKKDEIFAPEMLENATRKGEK